MHTLNARKISNGFVVNENGVDTFYTKEEMGWHLVDLAWRVETPMIGIHFGDGIVKPAIARKMDKELMENILDRHFGNRAKAAAEMGVSERTVYRYIKKLGIIRYYGRGNHSPLESSEK